jgi:hypothetical protein
VGIHADQPEKIRSGIRPHMGPQPERVQHGKHQQSLPGNSSLGFPQSRFRGPVPAKLCLQVSVDAAFRVANHLPQCAQALLGSDPSNNRAAGRPYGLSGGVFLSWSEGYRDTATSFYRLLPLNTATSLSRLKWVANTGMPQSVTRRSPMRSSTAWCIRRLSWISMANRCARTANPNEPPRQTDE